MSITRTTVDQIRDELNSLLQGFSDKYNVELGNAKYNSNNATFQLKVSTVNEDGTVNSPEATDYITYAQHMGTVQAEWLNKVVNNIQLGTCKLIGYKRANRKYPFIVEAKGSQYKMDEAQVIRIFG